MLKNDFYNVESHILEEGKIMSNIKINRDHDIFKGHFPGQPVVPGVCLTEIVKEMVESEVGNKLMMIKGSNIKFMAVVDPQVNPDLTYDITYKYVDEDISVSCVTSFGETVAFKFKGTFQKK
jgi:3-hydroxyacyl-[acyl-carrier-protein] dehydratase